MPTINNLNELLAERGFDTPYSWARAVYKYVDCGPWVQFMVEKEPAKKITQTAKVLNVGGRPWLNNPKELLPEFIQFLGFKTRAYRGKTDTYWDYIKLVEDYMIQKSVGSGNNLKLQLIKHEKPDYLIIQTTYDIPAKVESVYYGSPEVNTFDHEKCIGVRIGSIVEGSDVELQPVELLFPFESECIDNTLDDINEEASFYWNRDNSRWYCVASHGDARVQETWGKYTWDDPEDRIPEEEKRTIENLLNTMDFDPQIDKPFKCGDYEIFKYYNDSIF